ncbi:prepilin-type N-terminal cleavage/methylation domain-containing protein [Desulfobaculum xiamenense]|uniref:Prepilin-type N-terminal cleavage/methylation domain-containing protein n=1 Tax=Desulfobaculum xiamenense TaxID=995050 RepID=A0A846QTA0_9BACT|nr:prepilin-type N-terminal cleavage/methylation domain-containing protein [Desulfobaculum xiamenense]NJB67869.1 prepilin-type N-terminal cleavage/methylation domain-containing protein [Desulfobaculum xiamenense]
MRLLQAEKRKVSGFTLVEMAIVLVIIGIILAGVMKGRDIVRGSQVKQFSQGYAQKWVTIASTYYDKVGQHFMDGQDNGNSVVSSPNGEMDDVILASADANYSAASRATGLQALRNVGITPCTMIKSDLNNDAATTSCDNGYNIWERTVEGEWSGKSTVGVAFFNFLVNNARRNCVVIGGVPVDVAIGLDTLIDGQADGENGLCLNMSNYATAFNPGDWQDITDPGGTTSLSLYRWPDQDEAAKLANVVLVLDF